MTLRRALLLAAAALAVACAVLVALALRLAAPSPALIGAPPASLQAEAVQFDSASGSRLRGWYAEGRPGAGVVVLMHAVRGNRTAMVRRARLLRQEGLGVLLFDFQAHGESPGRHITFGHLEALDARAAVAFARSRAPGERIGALGVSLGGAAALLGPGPLEVDALALEAVYGRVREALVNRLHARLGLLGAIAAPAAAPVLEALVGWMIGAEAADLAPIERIGEARAPLILVAGTEDDRATLAEQRSLFERAPEPKQFWAVQGAGHQDFERHAPEDYRRRVIGFLAARLAAAP